MTGVPTVRELFFTIRKASARSWWQTLLWVGYNMLGSLMPLWGTYFLLKLHHQAFHVNDFSKHGEFALYTAAFLAPALQLVLRNIKDAKYVLGTGAVLFAVAGLVVAVNVYSGVVVGVAPPDTIDELFLLQVSIILFLASLGFAVVVTLVENSILNPNVRKADAEDRKVLEGKFTQKAPEPAREVRDLPPSPEDAPVIPEQDLAACFRPVNTEAQEHPPAHRDGEHANG
jgi:hypothetical protein